MGRALIRKLDGVPIEYQSKDAKLGTLLQNAINSGLEPDDYEEKYITSDEYKILFNDKIAKPLKNLSIIKKNEAKDRIKLKLKINDDDLEDLKESLF